MLHQRIHICVHSSSPSTPFKVPNWTYAAYNDERTQRAVCMLGIMATLVGSISGTKPWRLFYWYVHDKKKQSLQ